MAGWSMLADDSGVNCDKTPRKLQPARSFVDLQPNLRGPCEGLEVDGEPDTHTKGSKLESELDKLQCDFNKLLSRFLEKICDQASFRLNPPMLVNGKSVNLWKLFMVVREKGGYKVVSEKRLWDVVGEKSGLGVNVGPMVKLVYIKYLDTFERWLKRVDEERKDDVLIDCDANLGGHWVEIQGEAKRFLLSIPSQGLHGMTELELSEVGKLIDTDEEKEMPVKIDVTSDGLHKAPGSEDCGNDEGRESMEESDGVVCVECKEGICPEASKCNSNSDSAIVHEDICLKRKRSSVWETLNWVTGVAKNPCDPVIGLIPERSKWKSHGNEKVWKQVLLAREAIFLKRTIESSAEQSNWPNQKMHPCLYDDQLGATYNLRVRVKSEERLLSMKSASQGQTCQELSPGTRSDLEKRAFESEDNKDQLEFEKYARKHVCLGPSKQAETPEWTGVISDSDPKWFGTRIWPLEKVCRTLIERDPIGKGRLESCGCQVPGSVECVRFHVSEKRWKLKLELGSAFYKWNLDTMGEEVRKIWKDAEEKKFKEVTKLNSSSLESCFWDRIFGSFPMKSRAELVSYYFNVFLLERRGYQNRFTPDNISSDDDESECGPLRKVFGHQSHRTFLNSPEKRQTR